MVEPLHVAVLASGPGSNLQAVLDRCRPPAPADVVLVASNRPNAGSFARAERAGIPTYAITDPNDADALLAALRQAGAGFVVLAGYLRLLPEPVVDAFAQRMVNIHPALLPSFGGQGMYGMRVHRAVLASGATVTGPTVHLVTNEYDRGPILAQWPVPVRPTDTPEALRDRVLAAEHELLPAVILAAARAGAGRAVPLPIRGTAFAAGTHMPALQDQLDIATEPDR